MSNQQLTPQQTAQYVANAGFSGASIATMTAIALIESALNTQGPDNINTDGSRDRGLFQINNKWHPEVSDTCAYDPVCSSAAAFRISQQGQNFAPWATYTNGAYLTFLPDIKKEVAGIVPNKSIPSGDTGQGNAGTGNPVNDVVTAAFQPLFDQLPQWGIKIGIFMGALLLVIIGLAVLASNPGEPSGTIAPALNRAAKVGA